MTDAQGPFRPPMSDELPTVEDCREAAELFLPLAASGFWTPPQSPTPAPSDPGSGT